MNFDEDIHSYMNVAYLQLVTSPAFPGTEVDARLAVLALNLRAMANNFLAVDSATAPLALDLKKVALGLLGMCDFTEAALAPGIMEY